MFLPLESHGFARNALMALLFVALLVLSGCGSDTLATTQQAKQSASSASASMSGEGAVSSQDATANPGEQSVVVSIDTANAAAYNGKYPQSMGTFTVSVKSGDTVLDALQATGVDVAMRGRGYVSAIGGLEEKACGRDSGWLYSVDGTVPTKTADEFELSGGENVVWAYTVTNGDVEGAPAQ